MTAADRINANRPIALRVIEPDTFFVALDLEPIAANLIQDLAVALKRNGHLFTTLANLPVGSPEHATIRNQIVDRAREHGALQVTLGQDQADALANDLWEATTEPDWCRDCHQVYATRPDLLCDACGLASECREANIAQLRAV